MKTETIGDCTIILGDCREVLPSVADVDAVITDVPYGISGGWGSGLRKGGGKGVSRAAKGDYQAAFDDTPENIERVVAPTIKQCVERFGRLAMTPGLKNSHFYPKPDHVGTFQYPGSTVMSCWGPMLWQPIFYYGRDPHQGRLLPDSRPNCNDVDRDTPHPCPKPLKSWTWLVGRASLGGETVLDPFMGSGTTGVACIALGRKFIGIELEPRFFDLACHRIAAAYEQPRLFIDPPPQPKQPSLLGGGR